MNEIIIALLVFLARLVDVTMGTMRLKAIMRSKKLIAFVIAFFEVIIYTVAASYAFKYVDQIHILMMFALGYASGNFLGITIDEKINKCNIMIIVITEYDDWKLADIIRNNGYPVTTAKGFGIDGNKKSELKIITPKNKVEELKKLIKEHDDKAYIVVLDVKEDNRMPVRK